MKLLLYISLALSSTFTFSQDEGLDHIPISYYILTRPLILEGKILEIKDKRIIIAVKSCFKGETQSEKLTLQTSNKLGLELNQTYIFLLARKETQRNYLLYYPYQRMKVHNDSLFIPENNLSGIDENKGLEIHQPNTFNDPIFKAGYKISKTDFDTLVTEINETFKYYSSANGRHMRHRNNYVCYHKLKAINSSTTSFNLALLNQLDGFWEKKKCESD